MKILNFIFIIYFFVSSTLPCSLAVDCTENDGNSIVFTISEYCNDTCSTWFYCHCSGTGNFIPQLVSFGYLPNCFNDYFISLEVNIPGYLYKSIWQPPKVL